MSFFDSVYQKLFSRQDRELVLFEPIKRSSAYIDAFEQWKKSPAKERIMRELAESYLLKKNGISGSHEIHLLTSSRSNGIAISFDHLFDIKTCSYLFDWFAQKVLEQPYKKVNGDVTVRDKNEELVTTEKYYFKPKTDLQKNALIHQQFGNILIEWVKLGKRPSMLKIVANTYSDSKYHDAREFDELAEFLLEMA